MLIGMPEKMHYFFIVPKKMVNLFNNQKHKGVPIALHHQCSLQEGQDFRNDTMYNSEFL